MAYGFSHSCEYQMAPEVAQRATDAHGPILAGHSAPSGATPCGNIVRALGLASVRVTSFRELASDSEPH